MIFVGVVSRVAVLYWGLLFCRIISSEGTKHTDSRIKQNRAGTGIVWLAKPLGITLGSYQTTPGTTVQQRVEGQGVREALKLDSNVDSNIAMLFFLFIISM